MSSQQQWRAFLNSRVSARRKAQAALRRMRARGLSVDPAEAQNVLRGIAWALS